MHPAISAWPSAFFYQGRLLDAPAVRPGPDGTGGRAAPWHARRRLPPLAFWDCPQGRERGGGGGGASVSNQEEAEVAWALYCGALCVWLMGWPRASAVGEVCLCAKQHGHPAHCRAPPAHPAPPPTSSHLTALQAWRRATAASWVMWRC